MGLKLSIVTINKNNGYGLRKTIENVLFQSFKDFELIVIDGGSTDNSLEVIKDFEDRLSCWISEPDSGIYSAMNKGVKKAAGEYIQFSNSGDWFVNHEVLSQVFKEAPTEDIIYGNIIKMRDGIAARDKGLATSDVTFYHLFLGTINHPSTFVRRELFAKFGLFSEEFKYAGDWEWFIRTVGLANTTIRYIDLDISYFDLKGCTSKTDIYYRTERLPALNNLVPKRILKDINRLYELDTADRIIRKNFMTRLLYKAVYKLAKLADRKI